MLAPQGDYEASFMRQRPELQYDGMMFVKETKPIIVLRGNYQCADEESKRR
jgi:hypothetical protein